MVLFIIIALTAYMSGSIPFGKIIGNFYHIDIQKEGSGNIGFANVYRVLSVRPAVIVLLGDVLKGYVPAIIAKLANFSVYEIFAIGGLAIIGHLFPIWLKFRGGKGIATSLGLLLALSPTLAFMGIAVWFVVLHWTKMFSLASLSGAWTVLLLSLAFANTREYTLGILFIVITGTVFHTDNIKRILSGKEPRSWKW